MIGRGASFVAALLLMAAPAGALTYGETLLDGAHARHPNLVSARIDVTGKAGQMIRVERRWGSTKATAMSLPLTDAIGKVIGSIAIGMRCDDRGEAEAVAASLGRRTYSPDGLAEPDPLVAGTMRAPAAQAMVEAIVDHEPELVTLAFHVAPPGDAINRIVASSFGRIGKPADADDLHVVRDGSVLREMTNGGRRLAVELPLFDRRGRTIGALSTSFRIGPTLSPDAAAVRAVGVRDSIARKIASTASLFGPVKASRQVRRLGTCR